ncbi:tetratricopeptide repeat protein [Pelotalea chapellei]|uniref:Tetratricopeptide repeat protein n=1 Tax=Pelotalea chapellei TaxID=44671 RepID=A0ABS5U604_9BACT|nr:tetratricopeptide repeat protein [Pelotalea chapellei]MBT1071090.1 tetratricopeptide repeat protein [Pelotalea chapellei]
MKANRQLPIPGLHNVVLLASLFLVTLPTPSPAVQWTQLAQTARHNVALDTESVRLTSLGRLGVWLRFIPRGERQRREAATEHSQKGYRLHLEYYEIDCGENTSVMGLTDVLGAGGRRLSRKKGNGKPETIVPGSALDLAASKVCPKLEETPQENDEAPPASDKPAAQQTTAPEDLQQQIKDALQLTQREPSDFRAWVALGNAYYDAEMPDKAIPAYNRALAIKPQDTDVLNDQGAMYRQTGDFEKAVTNFEKAFAIDSSNLESLYNTGYVYAFDLNRIDKALQVWQRYLKLDNSSETARQVQSFIERYGE